MVSRTAILLVLTLILPMNPANATEPIPLKDLRTRKQGFDWPQFLGPNGNSKCDEKGIISPWPKEKGLNLVWQIKTGEGYSMPVIALGRLFLFDRVKNQARLRCLQSETGKPLWEFTYETNYVDKYSYSGGPRCSPIVKDGRVYIYGVEGMLHCLRADNGKVIWKHDTAKEFNVIQNFFGVGSTPVIEKDLLIVMVGGSPKGSDETDFQALKGNGTGIVAFNRFTGKAEYKISNDLASYASPVLATIKGRRWCFVFARSGLVAFDPATGKIDFEFPWRATDLESVNAANPVVVDNKVFITETYGPGSALIEVRPGGYKVIWSDKEKRPREKAMQCHWNTPIEFNGYIYGSSGRHDSNADLRCVELATGKVMWEVARTTRSSLLFVDHHFIMLGEYGHLLLFKPNPKKLELVSLTKVTDPATNEELLDYPCWAAPIVSHGLLYLRGRDRLVCLELIPQKKN